MVAIESDSISSANHSFLWWCISSFASSRTKYRPFWASEFLDFGRLNISMPGSCHHRYRKFFPRLTVGTTQIASHPSECPEHVLDIRRVSQPVKIFVAHAIKPLEFVLHLRFKRLYKRMKINRRLCSASQFIELHDLPVGVRCHPPQPLAPRSQCMTRAEPTYYSKIRSSCFLCASAKRSLPGFIWGMGEVPFFAIWVS